MQLYDLIVLGSGPGGLRAAIQAAKAGRHVAVVEKLAMVGGVCINSGTIPSKTMREAVLHLSGFHNQAFYGSNYHVKENITMSDLSFRVNRVIENEAAVLQDQLKRNGIEGGRDAAILALGLPGTLAAALRNGAVDAGMISPPFNFVVRDASFRELVSFLKEDFVELQGSILAHERIFQTEPATVEKFANTQVPNSQ